jgi:hypothetical protein
MRKGGQDPLHAVKQDPMEDGSGSVPQGSPKDKVKTPQSCPP